MRVKELKAALANIDDEMEVILRTDNDASHQIVCGCFHAGPDAGCTDREAFILDGDTTVPAEVYPEDDDE